MPKRILVIGGLAAGPSAASKAKRTNPECDVVLFEQGEDVSYGICEIPYFIAGEVEGRKLVINTPQQLRERKNIGVYTSHRVQEILPTRRTIVVTDLATRRQREEPFDKLIIAAGSNPVLLALEGADARNLFTVKSLQDGNQIHHYLSTEKPSSAVVIGGGYIGMEMCDALRSLGLEVTLLHNQSLPMNGFERETREAVRSRLEENGVTFVANAKTEGFVVDSTKKITHVVTRDGTFEAGIVIVAIGVRPNTTMAKAAGIQLGTYGGIITDQRQQTNLDNVYAAGDCCEVKNIVNNKSMYIPLATIASKQGWVAGENAAGGSAMFRGAIRAVAVRVFGLEVARVGLSAEEARSSGFDVVTDTITAWSRVAMMKNSAKLSVLTIADRRTKRLLGVNVWGEDGAALRANTFAFAVQQKITIDELQQMDLAYAPPFTPLWDPVLVAANSLRKKLDRH